MLHLFKPRMDHSSTLTLRFLCIIGFQAVRLRSHHRLKVALRGQ